MAGGKRGSKRQAWSESEDEDYRAEDDASGSHSDGESVESHRSEKMDPSEESFQNAETSDEEEASDISAPGKVKMEEDVDVKPLSVATAPPFPTVIAPKRRYGTRDEFEDWTGPSRRKKAKKSKNAVQDEDDDDNYDPATENLEWKQWARELETDIVKIGKCSRWGDDDMEEDQPKKKVLAQHETPSELVFPLLPFQGEFLTWSLSREESNMRGGVLADEMGMGKTIQAISLIIAGRTAGHGHDPNAPDAKNLNTTLVVCPVVAIEQWKSEIERFTKEGTLKVLIYHGNRKHITVKELAKHDVVLTTYSIIEHDYRKILPDKLRCKWCQKAYSAQGLAKHYKYHCGPEAKKSAAQSKQKKGKKKEVKKAVNQRKGSAAKDDFSLLHSVKWVRIILDEAHTIKDRASNTAKSVFALQSCYKWGLSGTPLQNRVGELYSLVRYLEINPYAYFFCKKCDCKSLEYSATMCDKCEHASTLHFCWWNKFIAQPISRFGFQQGGGKSMKLLRQKLLDEMLLRRTKIERAADLSMPPKLSFVRKVVFDAKEDDYYQSLYSQSKSVFNTYVKEGSVLNNYGHIFDLLTRLRQAVDHPYLVVHSATGASGVSVTTPLCVICDEDCIDPVSAKCKDTFCRSCLENLLSEGSEDTKIACPRCETPLTVDAKSSKVVGKKLTGYRKGSIINRLDLNDFVTSTKIEALKEEVKKMISKDTSAKGLVFSQFTSMLDLIGYSFELAGVKCVKLDGGMSLSQRSTAIDTFRNDPECKLFLMSLKAGGVALNLTVASYIFLMDPWWNPAVEHQAQDRIHRIGQYKPIRVTRFVIENSVEERILKLQEKKQLVFEGTVGGSEQALGKLTEQDLRFLFAT
ncbi:DNA repair protein RAD16 [Selaginella moellendorffii]|uniref:DNA repair protein RAD16 n=1 Tax=Selaginella moellendorffii TaxID=88036 RepID=UPI000D1C55A1|nr:DNA repair protein RAD16 [Selaginella moellendorffii]|eukprot:XP_024518292.1 DNA repair protein RAD16 [Selaginella moellendorffii]